MTTDVVAQLGEKYLPLPVECFFTPQRASDMWFGDELPPTVQDEMRSPVVTQAKAMVGMHVLQGLAEGQRRQFQQAEQMRRRHARSRVGGTKRY